MIHSILDSDLYKFTMQHAVIKLFPREMVKYEFINRSNTPFPDGFDVRLRDAISDLRNLKLQKSEKEYLIKTLHYIDPPYFDFLENYRYDPSEVGVILLNGELKITIQGYWYRTILWEVPLMALISELYFEMTGQVPISAPAREENNTKKATAMKMNNLSYADFGTRRRFSYAIQSEMVNDFKLSGGSNFAGTSNVHLAMKYNTKPIGTHAHEWFMFHAAKYGYKLANSIALDNWATVYRGDLGIALTDTFTTDVFLSTFDKVHAKLFDGVRHDSGDPMKFADKIIEHYVKLGIDPKSKTIVFSDGLNVKRAIEISDYVHNRIKISFGIGTNFSNDVGVTPLNMVIKLVQVKMSEHPTNWVNTVKLSDNPDKHTGNPREIEVCTQILNDII